MARLLVLVPLYMCVLSLMCCVSVADSRAVFFRVADEYGIDDGPQTFTMQQHFQFLKERELARRARGDPLTTTLGATTHLGSGEDEQEPLFVEDYVDPDSNNLQNSPGA